MRLGASAKSNTKQIATGSSDSAVALVCMELETKAGWQVTPCQVNPIARNYGNFVLPGKKCYREYFFWLCMNMIVIPCLLVVLNATRVLK